jgi:ATP-dependent Clp protease ATP-binding subunit ClpB
MAGEDNYEAMKAAVMEVVGTHFRPEFINRVDESVVFHPLALDQIRGIAGIQLHILKERLAERDLELEISDAFMDRLVEAGFDPVYGARPLKRAIQQELENPLAQRLLAGEFQPGQVISAELENGKPAFTARDQ